MSLSARREGPINERLTGVVTGQVVAQLVVRPVQVVEHERELVADAELAVDVRQELGRVPGVSHQRRRLDVAVLLVQLRHHRRVDEEQVGHELDVAARHGRVTVQDLDAVQRQFGCGKGAPVNFIGRQVAATGHVSRCVLTDGAAISISKQRPQWPNHRTFPADRQLQVHRQAMRQSEPAD
jgi:hypothetical protein